MSTSARRALLSAGAALLASGAMATAAQADTTYPLNANTFTNGAEGWQDRSGSCQLLGAIPIPIPLVCQSTNTHDAGVGNEPGSLRSAYRGVVNLAGLFSGDATWRSPTFTVKHGPTGGFLSLDRKAVVAALLDVGGEAQTTVRLVNTTADPDTSTTLLAETLTADDSAFRNRSVEVPAGILRDNTDYYLELATTFTSTALQAADGTIAVNYDNVGLRVFDSTDTGDVAPVVQTLLASEVTSGTANLNALVNPKGLTTTTRFEVTGPGIEGSRIVNIDGDQGAGLSGVRVTAPVDGLAPCATYAAEAVAANAKGESRGGQSQFSTTCAPTVETLPAAPVGVNEAGLNSSVRPNGEDTKYAYQLALTPDMANAIITPERDAGNSRSAQQPLNEPVNGLRANTTFYYRVLARNGLGNVAGDVVSFKTGVPTGPGAPGAPGPQGARGPSGVGSTGGNQTLRDGDERALLRIRQSLVQVGLKGKRAGQLRFRIFCRALTGRTCAGTVKIRTIGKINPSTRGRKAAKRRVTFATFEYQLAQGKAGVAIAQMTPEKVDLLRLRRGLGKSIGVQISVQVTDAGGNRQTIVRNGNLRLVNSPR